MQRERTDTVDAGWGEGKHRHMYVSECKTENEWGAAVQRRELCLLLCDDPEAWDGVGGRLRREGTLCIHTADSHCTAETNTALLSNYGGKVLGAQSCLDSLPPHGL